MEVFLSIVCLCQHLKDIIYHEVNDEKRMVGGWYNMDQTVLLTPLCGAVYSKDEIQQMARDQM